MRPVPAAIGAVVAAAVVLGTAGAAGGHAGLIGATPGPCEVVTVVGEVVVDFDQPVVSDRSGLEVLDDDGAVVATGEVVSDALLGGTIAAELTEPLPDGDYRVFWRNVSAVDGDPDRGLYGFTVGSDDVVAAVGCSHVSGAAAVRSDDPGSGAPFAAIAAVGVVVIAAVGAFVVLRRRSTG